MHEFEIVISFVMGKHATMSTFPSFIVKAVSLEEAVKLFKEDNDNSQCIDGITIISVHMLNDEDEESETS